MAFTTAASPFAPEVAAGIDDMPQSSALSVYLGYEPKPQLVDWDDGRATIPDVIDHGRVTARIISGLVQTRLV